MKLVQTQLGPTYFIGREDRREVDEAYRMVGARGPFSVDTEATGLDIYHKGFNVRLIQMGNPETAYAWDPYAIPELTRASVTTRPFAGVNIFFDLQILDRMLGITLEETTPYAIDLGLATRILDPRGPAQGNVGHDLGASLKKYCNLLTKIDAKNELVRHAREAYGLSKDDMWRGIPIEDDVYLEYAGLDVLGGSRLAEVVLEKIKQRGAGWLLEWEHEGAGMTSQVSRRGILGDVPYGEAAMEKLEEKHAELDARLGEDHGIKPTASGRHDTAKLSLVDKMLEYGAELTELTDSGRKAQKEGKPLERKHLALDKDVLTDLWVSEQTSRPVKDLARLVMDAKKAKHYSEYLGNFIGAIGEDGRIHAKINTLAAATARWSITDPALQQVPKDEQTLRGFFLPDPGEVIVSVDFDAVEVRVMAAFCEEENLIKVIESGLDPHAIVAEALFGPSFTKGQRDTAKGCMFGRAYGGGVKTISRQVGASQEIVAKVLKMIDTQYPKLSRVSKRGLRKLGEKGGVFRTATGRLLVVDMGYRWFNYYTQSLARDLYMDSSIRMAKAGLLDMMRLPVHDEWVLSVPERDLGEVLTVIKEAMENDFMGMLISASPEVLGERWRKG